VKDYLRAYGLLLLTVSFGGCVPLNNGDPLRIIAPEPVVTVDPAWPQVDWSLLVQRPVADQTRGGVRIVVRTAQSTLVLYPGVAWLDELPEMLQTEMLHAFADSGRIAAVARPGAARARFALATEIRRFDAVEQSRGVLAIELDLHATLVEVQTGEILASQVFHSEVPVAAADADALTDAFESALGQLIEPLIGWTLNAAPDTRSGEEAPAR